MEITGSPRCDGIGRDGYVTFNAKDGADNLRITVPNAQLALWNSASVDTADGWIALARKHLQLIEPVVNNVRAARAVKEPADISGRVKLETDHFQKVTS